ncbi:hypothetical protein [Tepidibacter hydrothermalis]|uniref:Uncharacterized protein n=1 Tax=Tepidibacter hydrothermalis TaxID=3036126 RepID=A0ABY8EJG0_9FIRM|nr:hypothetical protein [Tepidibacter hydrothermalis]WFD11098.1 hypothetical protein P4S50_03210 [Tepidibacter hydrothermalis]
MQSQINFLGLGLIIILFSSFLGAISMNVYSDIAGNLTTEYTPILEGFISSYRLIGFLLSCVGLIEIFKKKG